MIFADLTERTLPTLSPDYFFFFYCFPLLLIFECLFLFSQIFDAMESKSSTFIAPIRVQTSPPSVISTDFSKILSPDC